jgi:hypothetical protein
LFDELDLLNAVSRDDWLPDVYDEHLLAQGRQALVFDYCAHNSHVEAAVHQRVALSGGVGET